MDENKMDEINALTEKIIGAAIEVHRELGPGLLESTYKACLAHELRLRGIVVETEKTMAIRYKNLIIEKAYKLDLFVQELVIVELKSVDKVHAVHEAQLITYHLSQTLAHPRRPAYQFQRQAAQRRHQTANRKLTLPLLSL